MHIHKDKANHIELTDKKKWKKIFKEHKFIDPIIVIN